MTKLFTIIVIGATLSVIGLFLYIQYGAYKEAQVEQSIPVITNTHSNKRN